MRFRRELPVGEQRKRLSAYLRIARQNYNRAWREDSATFRTRRGCPYERSLRHRRFEDASLLLKLVEACLKDLNHCYALRIAGFRPGAHVLVTTVMKGYPPAPRRYIISDVIWGKRDSYYYEVQELTKAGDPHGRRYPTWMSPSNRISIEYCNEPLGKAGEQLAASSRTRAKYLLENVLAKGDLSPFLPKPPPDRTLPERQYPFWLRHS
jgi:hypothetical protein